MAKVDPRIKARLEAEGTWSDFTLFRDNAVKSGERPAAAMRLAVARFCPDLAGLPQVPHRRGSNADAEERLEEASRKISGRAADGVNGGRASPAAPSPSAAQPSCQAAGQFQPALVDPARFEGRTCSWAKAFDWVVIALSVDPSKVDPYSAPSIKAWALYVQCVRSPSFREEILVKGMVRQIPNCTRDEDSGDDGFDGQGQYDLLGRFAEKLAEVSA